MPLVEVYTKTSKVLVAKPSKCGKKLLSLLILGIIRYKS